MEDLRLALERRGVSCGVLRAIRWIARGALLAALSCGTGGGSEAPLGSSPSRADGIIDPGRAASRQLSLQQDAEEVQQRFSELQRSGGWRARGYFTAEEHDAIEWLLFRFVTIHRAFWGEIDGLGGLDLALTRESQKPGAHVLALHAGLNLADSSAFLVERFRDDPVAIAKLNEAFSRSEIPAGSYDRLALAVTGAERRQALATAWQLHEHELADPEGSAIAKVGTDPALASVLASLEPLHQRVSRRLAELDVTARPVLNRLDHSRAADAARGSGGRFAAVGYETRALVFTDVSRIKSPATYVIVFSSEQKRALHELLRPGDLILTYTAGYVSSAFIPGVFKHGITYVGLAPQRSAALRLYVTGNTHSRRHAHFQVRVAATSLNHLGKKLIDLHARTPVLRNYLLWKTWVPESKVRASTRGSAEREANIAYCGSTDAP